VRPNKIRIAADRVGCGVGALALQLAFRVGIVICFRFEDGDAYEVEFCHYH